MKRLIIIFVSASAPPINIQSEWRANQHVSRHADVAPPVDNVRKEITDHDQLPLWTWFLPNPCP